MDSNRSGFYQTFLIISLILVAILTGIFTYREIFPEYRNYQKVYQELENFRSSYTGEAPPQFHEGVKQIVLAREDRGPETIDRCTTCHVALNLEHFSPTIPARDVNGQVMRDELGHPVLVPNESYVWKKLDEKIAALRAQGNTEEAKQLEALKTVEVGDQVYDMTKVLAMHPLMGRETRPFELHSVEEMGCTACHGGNGRSITTDRAHGPVFDGTYEIESEGHKKQFLEIDSDNDPAFARLYNGKPGHKLLFQTHPLYLGGLMEANCAQCHATTKGDISSAKAKVELVEERKERAVKRVEESIVADKIALNVLASLKVALQKEDITTLRQGLEKQLDNYLLNEDDQKAIEGQLAYLDDIEDKEILLKRIEEDNAKIKLTLAKKEERVTQFHLFKQQTTAQDRTLFTQLEKPRSIAEWSGDIDLNMRHYLRGKELFVSQACYACHRIDGYSRGGVGPELTREGYVYPWFVKESIVWPQADLKSSAMPNFHLDHDEVEDLMSFVMAQKGKARAISETDYKVELAAWEGGAKLPLEQPLEPKQIYDLNDSMTIFATEGCASCHRLKGFKSSVGYTNEKNHPDFAALEAERTWFSQLFPEGLTGKELVETLETHEKEIRAHLAINVKPRGLLDELEAKDPELLPSFYDHFKYAARAKDTFFKEKKDEVGLKNYQELVDLVMMQYIQEYGLGRLIGPRLNWSGIYRSDQWLIEHFKNPNGHSPKTIMPVMPFDETKFYALAHMLDVLAVQNRDETRRLWKEKGFNPGQAYQIYCASCHGAYLQGNGPVSEWIYPIPKNLRDGTFLQNLTKKEAVASIVHGVKGTPMPPWGEVAPGKEQEMGVEPVLTEQEITQLVDWLYSSLPTPRHVETDVPKWNYSAEDVTRELVASKQVPSNETVEDLFTKKMVDGEPFYRLNKDLYTQENIHAGQAFFVTNCSICHGKEGAGNGNRAQLMIEAKPRMLSNLDWIDTKDDLYILRSIKYGAAGTSMTPWGDFTSPLQRIQLAIFIRELSKDRALRERLSTLLYQAFDEPEQLLLQQRADLPSTVGGKATDDNLQALGVLIKKEGALYRTIGLQLVERQPGEPLEHFFSLLELQKGRYTLEKGSLVFHAKNEQQEAEIMGKLMDSLNAQIHALEGANDAKQQIRLLNSLKNKVGSGLRDAAQLYNEQQQLYKVVRPSRPEVQLTEVPGRDGLATFFASLKLNNDRGR